MDTQTHTRSTTDDNDVFSFVWFLAWGAAQFTSAVLVHKNYNRVTDAIAIANSRPVRLPLWFSIDCWSESRDLCFCFCCCFAVFAFVESLRCFHNTPAATAEWCTRQQAGQARRMRIFFFFVFQRTTAEAPTSTFSFDGMMRCCMAWYKHGWTPWWNYMSELCCDGKSVGF